MKKVFCLILSLVMVLSVVPVGAMATGDTAQQTDVNSDIGLEGTNSFGNLLSDALEDAEADEQANGGYSVVGLQIEGSTATVEYSSIEDANLLVCIYTEDGMQLMASGNTTVSADEDFAQVEIEGEMPKYFMASAYLVDTYDFSPLCEAYDTPMYTQEMQELLASTVEDYDADKVVQLTDSTQTNFAVYNDSVVVIDGGEGVNTVASVDYENDVYIIENADEQITSLSVGAIFAYPWAEGELLIVKVASIAVDGTTATVTGAELELEEVFDHMKLETTGGMDGAELDESTLEEGVTYKGIVSDKPATKAWEGDAEVSKKLSLKVEKDFPNKAGDEKITVSGSVELSIKGELAFYLSWKKQFIEIKATPKVGVALEISGELTVDELSLGEMKMPTGVPGVVLEGSPKLVLQCQEKIEFSAELSIQLGIGYDSKKGFQNLCKKPSAEADIEISGKVYFGLKIKLEAAIIDSNITSVGISNSFGVQITGKFTGTNHDGIPDADAKSIHRCASCLDMSFDFVYKLSGTMTIFKFIKLEKEFKSVTVHLFKFYVSLDSDTSGFGSCPNLVYRTTLTVKDENGKTVGGASVATGTAAWGTTNSNGVLVKYLPAGDYTVKAEKGELSAQKTITVEDAANVTLSFGNTGDAGTQPGIFDALDSENYEGETIAEQGTCGDNATWKLTQSGILYISGTGALDNRAFDYNDNIKKVVIFDGITSIGSSAFYRCTRLTSVTIPDSVTSIGERAFYICTSLTSVTIPDSVTSIGYEAFRSCYRLTSVTIGNSVTSIGSSAFEDCTSLTAVTIGDSVTSIGSSAFYDCSSLTSITIPDSVESIGSNAFYDCTSLTSVTIGDSVTAIPRYAFYHCDSLTSVTIPDSVESIGSYAFYYCTSLTSVTIGDSVTSIDNYAFYYCTSLTSVTIGDSVEIIGSHAFYDCSSLTSITIPDSVESIGDRAFCGCRSLTSVTIGDGVTSIGDYAFSSCTSLTSVTIPDSVSSIGDLAFARCTSLTGIWVDAKNPAYCSDAAGVLYNKDKTTLIQAPAKGITGAYTIPGSVTAIPDYAFYYCTSLTSVTIGNSVTSIGDDAFRSCTSLTSVTIGNSVTSIGSYAFYWCTSLTAVTIPDSVTSIGSSAFENCSSLTAVTIGNSVTSIGSSAFEDCSSLTAVTIPDSVTSIGSSAFYDCDSLTSVTIPDSVTSIGYCAFWGCSSLTTVTIGSSVESIDEAAFKNCTSLHTIVFRGDAPQFGYETFRAVSATAYYPADNASWTSSVQQNYGSWLTWVAYQPESGYTMKTAKQERQLARGTSTGGVFSGEYSNEGTLRTASFADLVPGAQYLLLVLADMRAEDPLAASNLLFVDQAAADENGKLVFTYIQRIETDASHVMVCGASNQNLRDATITFPDMCADVNDEHQVVSPVVVYDGTILEEGQDYVLLGKADYTQAGTYTCYIRGIYNYTGLVACTYEVLPWSWTLACDLELAALEIPAGQVLDLNGHTLIVDSLVSFGQIIDSVGGGGLVAEDLEITANDWLPVLDSDGCYRFCEYEVRNLGSKETANGVVFGFALDLADHTMLLDSDDVQVTVTLAVGESTQTYVFSKELVAEYAQLLTKYPGLQAAMQLHVTGMDALEDGTVLTVTPGITAVGGRLENDGAAMTYTA